MSLTTEKHISMPILWVSVVIVFQQQPCCTSTTSHTDRYNQNLSIILACCWEEFPVLRTPTFRPSYLCFTPTQNPLVILQVVLREAGREEISVRHLSSLLFQHHSSPLLPPSRTTIGVPPLLPVEVEPQIQWLGKMLDSVLTCQIQILIFLAILADAVLIRVLSKWVSTCVLPWGAESSVCEHHALTVNMLSMPVEMSGKYLLLYSPLCSMCNLSLNCPMAVFPLWIPPPLRE